MNDDDTLYSKHCGLQKRDVSEFLDRYFKLFTRKKDAYILDVGGGEGTITLEILLPRLQNNFKKLVIGDIQQNLLKSAEKRNTDPRIECCLLDISDIKIVEGFHEHFNYIFSFNCLNWIADEEKQQQAIQNIFDMLKPGGDILLTIVSNFSTYDYCENMAETEKWTPYMKNVEKFTSPYHHLENPLEKLKHYLNNVGFELRVCEIENRFYTYPNFSHYLNFALSVNAFVKKIPNNRRDDFVADFEKEIRKHDMITIDTCEDGNEKVCQFYRSLIVCASKPL